MYVHRVFLCVLTYHCSYRYFGNMDEYQELWDDWELLDQLEEDELEDLPDAEGAVGRRRRRIVKGKMWQQGISSCSFSVCH